MKRTAGIICFSVIAALMLTCGVFAEHIGIKNTDDLEKQQVLQLLEIMNGDQNGNLHLDNTVTRAEFVKMAISASTHKSSAKTGVTVSLFPDVTSSHWAAGYISSAIKAGYVTGYLDGTFKPSGNVRLEEAVIIVLKMLGYTANDFVGTYPEAQLAKYEEIDLDTDINAVRGDYLTRRECMKLIYNMLCTETKQGTYYCQTLGYATDSDGTVDYLALLASSMTGPFVNNENSWKSRVPFAADEDICIYRDGKTVSDDRISEYDVYYYSTKIDTVWFYSEKAFGKIDSVLPNLETPSEIVLGQSKYSLLPAAAVKVAGGGTISKDDYVMVLLDKDGKAADIVLADAAIYEKYSDEDSDLLAEVSLTLSDAVFVESLDFEAGISLDLDKADIIMDGETISKNDIKINDVIYYSVPFNTAWVYRDTVSGVCTAVMPARDNPSSVTVSGKNYSLETDKAVYSFSKLGTLKDDMLVTLYLGKDGGVVAAKRADKDVIGSGENQVPYADVVNATLKGPYVASEDGKLPDDSGIKTENASVYKNNKKASVSDIKKYNVYYYSKLLNTVWLYEDTVTGTVEQIQPSRVSPTGIVLSGKSYTFSGAGIKYDFSSLGTYGVGDRVTLLLGKDKDAVGVVSIDELNSVVYGVVLGMSEKSFTDSDGDSYIADCVSVFAVNGETYSYETRGDFVAGDVVKVAVSGDKNQIVKLKGPSSISDSLAVRTAIKNGDFAADAKIIEYYNKNIYSTVSASRISGLELTYRDILYYELDDKNDITLLILDNCTGDLVEYGILTDVEGSSYKYNIDGSEKSFNSGDTRYIVEKGPAFFALNGSQINKIGNLNLSVKIKIISAGKAYDEKNTEYEIDDNVKVFTRNSDGGYKLLKLDDIKNGEYSSMTGYYDRTLEKGGKIRVILTY